MVEVLASSPLNTIQDLGRPHALILGVSKGGAMDPISLSIGNILVGNPRDLAGIEVVFFPFRLRFTSDTVFSVTGADCLATLDEIELFPSWVMRANAGQVLSLFPPKRGCRAYVSLRGGIDVPMVLGSRSTDSKGGFGGVAGRGLERGDRLTLGLPGSKGYSHSPNGIGVSFFRLPLPLGNAAEIRFLAAAEYEHFTSASLDSFESDTWHVSVSANRTGYRMEGGSPLQSLNALSLKSHGILPGVIQVPPAGLPIVQLADANTCGGYPKIGTVIAADIPLLAQLGTGGAVRFRRTTRDVSVAALRQDRDFLNSLEKDLAF